MRSRTLEIFLGQEAGAYLFALQKVREPECFSSSLQRTKANEGNEGRAIGFLLCKSREESVFLSYTNGMSSHWCGRFL